MQSTTEPDNITDLVTTSAPYDGRYRTFNWTVPRDNGLPLLDYTLRKMDVGHNVLYDYNWTCAEISCVLGEHVSVTIGSDLDPLDGSYLVPTTTYKWKLIAHNTKNYHCAAESTCDVNAENFGTGWTPSLLETQGVATPDRAVIGSAATVSQTELRLLWTPPNSNGANLLQYRATCVDTSNYLDNATFHAPGGWRQPNKVRTSCHSLARAPTSPALTSVEATPSAALRRWWAVPRSRVAHAAADEPTAPQLARILLKTDIAAIATVLGAYHQRADRRDGHARPRTRRRHVVHVHPCIGERSRRLRRDLQRCHFRAHGDSARLCINDRCGECQMHMADGPHRQAKRELPVQRSAGYVSFLRRGPHDDCAKRASSADLDRAAAQLCGA